MNSLSCVSDAIRLDEIFFEEDTAATENMYTTILMPAVEKPICQRSDEEELHTSFEEAISDRLQALHTRLDYLSRSIPGVKSDERNTDAIFSCDPSIRNIPGIKKTGQSLTVAHRVACSPLIRTRTTLFICSSMAFMLLGFDLMGFLMLHMH